ncbi:PAS domain-containing protein [Cytophagales bacterium LB-30]|uniref:histidine kinase n=1 Tax=Shiella aurantiaca TaxID=3058365 RepID=A0ABT8F662_9BACT|nr:PAS domain-containing protein [Shiella aurantiaca]MDN4165957.1 PAS domain-containing protein [Shiella aurantiaca]
MISKQLLESLFSVFPQPGLLLQAEGSDFIIVDANEAYLHAVNRPKEFLLGKSVLEAFPPNPSEEGNSQHALLLASFNEAIATKKLSAISELRYDVLSEDNIYLERYWNIKNSPLKDEHGRVVYVVNSVEDVTELVLARQKLNRNQREIMTSQSLLEQAERIAHFGTWELNLQTNELYWSDGVYRICGYTREDYPLNFESGLAIIHPDDQARALAVMQDAMKTHKEYNIEKRFVTSTGEIKNIISKGKVIFGPNNEPQKLFGVFQDVSQQKRAQEDIQKTKENLQRILDSSLDIICTLDIEGKFVTVSAASYDVLGYLPKEMEGRNLMEFVVEADHEKTIAISERLFEGEEFTNFENRYKHKDGHLVPMIWSVFWDAENQLVHCVGRDGTERLKAEENERKSQKRYKALVQEGSDLTAILNADGVYLYVSPNYPSILGHSEEDLMGQTAFQFIHPADLEQVQKEFSLLEQEKRVKSSPYRFKRKDNTWCWVQTVGTNLLEDPEVRGIVINSVEITDLVSIQEAIRQSNQRFELIMQASTESIWEFHPISGQLFLGEGFNRNFGIAAGSLHENNELINERLHPEDKQAMLDSFRLTLHQTPDTRWSHAYRIRKENGEYAHVKDRAIILRDTQGVAYRVVGAIQDVSQEYFYQQMEVIEKEVMELSMQLDASAHSVISSYLLKLESLFPDMKASVLEIKNNSLHDLASPSMPRGYMEEVKGLEIGENAGSCATAAYLKKKVIVSDIFTDIRWEKYKHLGLQYGFAACWSQPIFNTQGEVVATFANYYPSQRSPMEKEEYAIDRAHRLLSVLLSRFESLKNIQESNERYDLVNKATKDAIYDWDIKADIYHWGEAFQRTFGHEISNEPFRLKDWVRLMHPVDSKKHEAAWEEFMTDPAQDRWNKEFRFRKADGSYAYAEEIGHMIRDSHGTPLRMIGVLRDISRNKRFELQNQIQQEIANFFKKEESLKQTLHHVLPYLGQLGHVKAAEIWLSNGDGTHLKLISHYAETEQALNFYTDSHAIDTITRGTGLPGIIWKEGKVVLWENIDASERFIRYKAAQKAHLKSAFGFPLFHKGEIIGVLVLLNDTSLREDSSQTALFEPLGHFLGAEIKRKQQEEEMLLLFQGAPDILAIASPNGHFIKVNPAFCTILGYTEEELTQKPFAEFLHPDDLNPSRAEYHDTITGERHANNFINRYRTRSGKYRWISWNSSDTFGEDDCVFAYGRDITETIELRKLLDNASYLSRVGGWEVDLVNNIHHWSSITKEIHEVPKEYVPSMENALAFYHEDYREMVKERVEKAIREANPYDFEAPIITAKNTLRWVRSIGYPEFEEGKCVRLWGSIQDIHERKVMELRLKNVSNNIPGVIFQYHAFPDGSDGLFLVSDGSNEVWGVSPEECMANAESVWKGIRAGGDSEEMVASIQESAKNLSRWRFRYRYLSPQGSLRYLEGFGNPQRQSDGSIIWDSIVMDITEKHDLELLAQRTSKMARIGSWELSLAHNEAQEMYWSPMMREIMEVDADYKPTFSGGLEFYLPESRNRVKTATERLIATGEEFDLELLLITAKGKMRWVRYIGQSDRVNNVCQRIFGSFQDIHGQKNAELELKETLNDRNTILESIGDGFIAVDRKFTITYWNQAAEKLLGPKKEEALGKNLWRIYGDAVDSAFYINYHIAITENKAVHFEEFYPTLEKWFEISAYPNPNGLSVYFRDITLRKMAQEQIRLSNERFAKVAEATNDAIWDWDIANDTLYWGDGFRKLIGYDPETMTPTMELYTSLLHPEDADRVLQSIDETLQQTEINQWQAEYRYQRLDGQYLYVQDSGAIIRNEKGEAIRMVGAVQDLTPHKEYEESLKALNQQLAMNLKELATSNAELEQFAYVASHDLQEPLRMITSFLTQLEKKYNPIIDERGKQYIQFAVDGAKRMRQIILDLLEFSRVGRSEDATQTQNLSELLTDVCALFRRAMEEKHAEITWDKLPDIKAQATPIRQLFQNLISNSLKYQKADVAPHIHISATDHWSHWEFAVSDNGIGIAPEYSEKIFTIFQRLHNKGEYSGTGMGLAICKKIVENMGGKIWVVSEEGKGSKFYFTLPK